MRWETGSITNVTSNNSIRIILNIHDNVITVINYSNSKSEERMSGRVCLIVYVLHLYIICHLCSYLFPRIICRTLAHVVWRKV